MRIHICISFGLVLLLSSLTLATIPQQISYQGKVTGAGNWTDTTVSMTFTVYSDSNGLGPLWTETQSGIAVKGGLFTAQLGKVIPIPGTVFNGATRWLGMRIGAGTQMTPLTRIVSQPNAYHALSADSASTLPDNAVTSAKIANGTIQLGDIGQNGASTGKIIKWNGSAWALANDSVVAGGNISGFTDNGTQVNLINSGDTVSLGSASPKGKLHVQGDIAVSASSGVKFGGDSTQLKESTGNLRVQAKNDLSLLATNNVYIGLWNSTSYAKFDSSMFGLGIGTLTLDDKLHVKNPASGGISFLRLQTSHATNWGEAGLRIQTPENTWHLRMDDYSHNNLPTAGSLALRSGDAGSEVMTWLEDGKVGIGTTSPAQKLHVYGNAQVKDTLKAGTVTGTFAGTYKDSSIHAVDIQDEPGIASRYIGAKGLSGSDSVIDSVIIKVPAAGYVWVIASGSLMSNHTFGDWTLGYVWVNDSATGLGDPQGTFWFPYNLTSGYYEIPFSCQAVFRVAAAGTYTYYSGGQEDTDAIIVYSHTITALYFPTNYGTVEVSPAPLVGETNHDRSVSVRPQSRLQQTAAIDAAKPDLATLEARLNALLQEAGALKSAITEMKKD